nr:PEP-CTERM sorting domain-containing protein [uncultured Noviherbaspirillum sp.]
MKITTILTSRLVFGAVALACAAFANTARAATFTNGGFEDGTINGWTTGGGSRTGTPNATLAPTQFLPGGSLYTGPSPRSAIISAGTVDPNVGAALGNTVYSGNFSYRAEDTTTGGLASAISQKVTNYTDPNIFFAWKAVLENGGHSENQSAEMIITLRDDTTGTDVISRIYNAGAGGGGVDTRFTALGDLFYTSQWQIEQLVIDQALAGHDFTLSLLAADCLPSAHTGYVYLDGFGGVLPDPGTPGGTVPEPGTAALLGLGVFGFVASRRKSVKSRNA